LGGLAKWDWFVTVTFSGLPASRTGDQPRLVSPAGARYFFNRYLGWIEDAVNGWGYESSSRANGFGYADRQQYLLRQRVRAFRGDEYGPLGGHLHIHALVAGVAGVASPPRYCGKKLPPGQWGKQCCWTHCWPCGFARVLLYDPKLGAGHYVSKYVTKRFGDWEFYGFGEELSGQQEQGIDAVAAQAQIKNPVVSEHREERRRAIVRLQTHRPEVIQRMKDICIRSGNPPNVIAGEKNERGISDQLSCLSDDDLLGACFGLWKRSRPYSGTRTWSEPPYDRILDEILR
jgi:hypothetical protein